MCVLGLFAYTRHHEHPADARHPNPPGAPPTPLYTPGIPAAPPAAEYSCDGRTYCSQMTSCDEAKYFLAHCPGVKMDGDGDGIPCERQWCGGS
ncbi:MAG: excalibur calcium-binding domain-containing protein [Proteobacteria bacterium]|nr:excalibur calcium-binding domain-containing protein [Pseudomonadota bacterium]